MRSIAVVFVLLLATPAAAEPKRVTLQDAIALAKQHAFSSRISAYREASAAADVGVARVAFLPDLTATVNVNNRSFVLNPDYPFPIDRTHEESVDADITANYTLLSTTRRLDVAAAKQRLESQSANNELARRAVVRDVARAYLQVVQSDALLRLAEGDVSRRSRHLEEARALSKAGKRAEFEVIRAEAELAIAESSLVEARNNTRLARSTLSQVCGTELGVDFVAEAPAPPIDPRRENVATSDLVGEALKRRPDVRGAEADAAAARIAWSRADRAYLPTLSLYANYSRDLNLSERDAFESALSAGGQLQIRFSNTLANAWRTKAARADSKIAEIVASQTRVAISLEVERASLEANRASEVLAAVTKSVDASRRNYESVTERYRLGVASQTERVDAEAALVTSEVDAVRADVAYRTALWNLRYEMGETLEAP